MTAEQYNAQRKWRIRMLFLHGVMLAAPLALLLTHSRLQNYTFGTCVFRATFGVDCPTCGITRSAMSMFAGHPAQAFCFHPAGPLVVAIIAFLVVYFAVVLFTKIGKLEWRKEVKAYNLVEVFALVVLILGWIGKLIT